MDSTVPAWAALLAPLTSLPPLPPKRRDVVVPTPTPDSSTIQRMDGRQPYEMRRIFLKTGVIQRAEGSCYFSQGKTRMMCSVFGPKSNRGRGVNATQEIVVEVTFSPFCQPGLGRTTRTGGGSGQASRSLQDLEGEENSRLSSCIVQTFQSVILADRFPNSSVEICLLVIQNDGGLFSAAINCVSLALADARIPMRDICACASVCMFDLHPPSVVNNQKHISESSHDPRPRKIVDQRNDSLSSPPHPIFLVDPTLDELSRGPLNTRFSANGLNEESTSGSVERSSALVHLGLCASDLSVAFLDAAGIPLEPPMESQLLQLAETACCATAKAFKEQLRSIFVERQAKEAMEIQLSSELLTMVNADGS